MAFIVASIPEANLSACFVLYEPSLGGGDKHVFQAGTSEPGLETLISQRDLNALHQIGQYGIA